MKITKIAGESFFYFHQHLYFLTYQNLPCLEVYNPSKYNLFSKNHRFPIATATPQTDAVGKTPLIEKIA